MMPRFLNILLGTLLLTILHAPSALAQDEPDVWVHPDYTLKQWTRADGLPSNSISSFLQTSDGYLWIGTPEGLARFDGTQFTTFNPVNTPSLRDPAIGLRLFEGPPGHLWIHDKLGQITLYREGVFTPFDVVVVSWSEPDIIAEEDTVWIGALNGVMRYAGGRMEPYRHDQFNGEVGSLARDGQGRLWVTPPARVVSSWEGVIRLDPNGEMRHYTAADGLPSTSAQNLLIDDDDVVWVGMIGGVATIRGDEVEAWHGSPETFYFVRLIDPREGVWISAMREGWWHRDASGSMTFHPYSHPHMYEWMHIDMRQGPAGKVWRSESVDFRHKPSTLRDGIFREGERIFGIMDALVNYTIDRDGSIWVGTGFGLFQLQPRVFHTIGMEDGLPDRVVWSMAEAQQGDILLGTINGGVARLDTQGTVSPLPNPNATLSIWSVYADRSGTIWVGPNNAPLCQIQGGRCREAEIPLAERFRRNVEAMYEDRQGRFWLSAGPSLAVRQTEGARQRWSLLSDLAESATDVLNLPFRSSQVAWESLDGTLFFATTGGGLLRYGPTPSTRPPRITEGQPQPGSSSSTIDMDDFEAFTMADGLLSNTVHDIYEDQEGYLWVALNRGLCRLDRGNQPLLAAAEVACIDSESGLHHYNIAQIEEDNQGRFWFNSMGGIFWIERAMLNAYFAGETPAVASASYTEGQSVGLADPSRTQGPKASDGRIYFPTNNGVVVIDPEQVSWPEAPPVVLEAVQVGEEVRRAPETLALQADERDVSIQYTALEFMRPDDVQFQYWLDGYDDGWRDGGNQRMATYTNLSPGSYTFRVRSGLAGLWSEAVTLSIEREPYFWQTTWFLVLVGLVFLSAGPVIYTLRVRQLKAREAELEQMVDERTEELKEKATELERANKLKSRFLANISHEFRTPLTLTFGPLDDALNDRFASLREAKPHFARARRNGSRLLRLINQLLDLSKLDAGALMLHPKRLDLTHHLKQLAAQFESLALNRGLHFATTLPDEPIVLIYDADKIDKVIINLLSNAFKFTPSGGKISLRLVQENDGTAEIEVADTGPGIAEEHLASLFDRFYQVEGETTRSHEGSGIGLSLVKELVELHEGTVEVNSTVGFGTRFTVRLPLLEVEVEADEPELTETIEPHPPEEHAPQAHVLDLTLAENTSSSEATQSPTQTPKPKIDDTVVLVIEDNADMRAYIRSHLEQQFAIVEAENGKVGIERAQEIVPDLVLSDVMMPEMDGLEACAALKADERTSHIPVVLLTARATVEHRIEGFESGADAYLPKPFNAEELQVRVRTMVEERRRLRARFAAMSEPPKNDPLASGPSVEQEIEGDGAETVVEEPVRPVLPPREAAFVEKVHALVDAHLGDVQFSVDTLADALSMSRRQLFRKLNALTNETPGILLRRRRMETAEAMFRAGEDSVKAVCYAVGFQSASAFGRAFREAYSMPPSAYIQQLNKDSS